MENKVVIEGNLTREPELKTFSSGSSVVSVSIAHNESYQKSGEWIKVSHFFDIKAFNASGERLNQFHKGDAVHIEGKLKQDRWEDKTTHEKKSRTYILAMAVDALSDKPRAEKRDAPRQAAPQKPTGDSFDDDIPAF